MSNDGKTPDEREIGREGERERGKEGERERERGRERERDRERQRETERQRDRETERQRERSASSFEISFFKRLIFCRGYHFGPFGFIHVKNRYDISYFIAVSRTNNIEFLHGVLR